jgi:hypothetical protein
VAKYVQRFKVDGWITVTVEADSAEAAEEKYQAGGEESVQYPEPGELENIFTTGRTVWEAVTDGYWRTVEEDNKQRGREDNVEVHSECTHPSDMRYGRIDVGKNTGDTYCGVCDKLLSKDVPQPVREEK